MTGGVNKLYFIVMSAMAVMAFSGCSPSESDVEELVSERLNWDSNSFSLFCPLCSEKCLRNEHEVDGVVEVGDEGWQSFIKVYYSCASCKKAHRPCDYCKTWVYSLWVTRERFWYSLRHDWILPIRRRPKCLLFKLFSGDFFPRYNLGYCHDNLSSIEKCESRGDRISKKVKGWMITGAILIYLLVEAIKKRATIIATLGPKVKEFWVFAKENLFWIDFDDVLFAVEWVLKGVWWLIWMLIVLQMVLKFWDYWNN